MTGADVTLCRSCGARVFFAAGRESGRTPIDADPAPNGTIRITPAPGGGFRAVVAAGYTLESLRADGVPLYVSHFATCPDGGMWRNRKGKK